MFKKLNHSLGVAYRKLKTSWVALEVDTVCVIRIKTGIAEKCVTKVVSCVLLQWQNVS